MACDVRPLHDPELVVEIRLQQPPHSEGVE